jgi:hypothetical protein
MTPAYDRYWHFSAVPTAQIGVRFRGECVAKLAAALRKSNIRIQLNGVLNLEGSVRSHGTTAPGTRA